MSPHSPAGEDASVPRAGEDASVPRAAPGRADVPVGTANEKAKEKAANDTPLPPHSPAGEDASVPRAGEDASVPTAGCTHGARINRNRMISV